VASVIVGARTPAQVEDNALAAPVRLEDADLQEITRIGRSVTEHLPDDKTNMWA
jgi:aryl-alcohol dehydrogenase-like predicted oxidoreductase